MRIDDVSADRPSAEDLAIARWTRRRFLTTTGAAAALAMTTGLPTAESAPVRRLSDYPFQLGIASGDPLPDAVVIWTRLAPRPLEPLGGMPVDRNVPVNWEVAEDESFRRVVRRGTAFARPEFAHSVHVDVQGLRPAAEYFYRFRTATHTSPTGRTKTAPALGANPSAMNLAFVSCQHRVVGYYTAYQHLQQEDVDVVFHLGDYIYEGPDQGTMGRGHLPNRFLLTLDDYRIRFAQYKTDPDLQGAHAAFPFIVTLDDHEVLSNWVSKYSFYYPQESFEEFLIRRANAFRAYWEHMPMRLSQLPKGPDMPLYRRFTFGRLAEFSVLDTRQYRDDQAHGDGTAPPDEVTRDPNRTMLGAAQNQWLFDGLDRSQATWNVLAQQVLFSQLDLDIDDGEELYVMDAWDGYQANRDQILNFFHESAVSNPIILTGDVHAHNACDVKLNYDNPDSPTLGAEFSGTSISSGGDGHDSDAARDRLLAAGQLPHFKYYHLRRGYVRCTVTPDQWRTDFKVMPYVSRPGAPISTDASFVVENGRPGLQRA